MWLQCGASMCLPVSQFLNQSAVGTPTIRSTSQRKPSFTPTSLAVGWLGHPHDDADADADADSFNGPGSMEPHQDCGGTVKFYVIAPVGEICFFSWFNPNV